MRLLAVALLMSAFMVPSPLSGVAGGSLVSQQPLVQNGATAGSIVGQVWKLDGSPSVGTRVRALGYNSPGASPPAMLAGLAQTDSAGRYRIDGLPSGRYYLAAGFLDSPTYFPGVTTVEQARPVTVSAGASSAGVDLVLAQPAGARVAGRVAGIPSGIPSGLVRIELRPAATRRLALGALQAEMELGGDGVFEFSMMTPGAYVPVITVLGRATTAMEVVVGDNDIIGLDLAIAPMIVGQVEVEGGGRLPVPSAAVEPGAGSIPGPSLIQFGTRRVDSTPAQGANAESVTFITVRADGFFSLPATPGNYRVVVTLPIGYYVRSVSYGMADLVRDNLKIDATPTAQIHVALTTARPAGAPSGVRVSGKIVWSEAPPAGKWVTFQTTAPQPALPTGLAERRVGEAAIREDGTFELRNVPSGDWTLTVTDNGSGIASQDVRVGDRGVTGIELRASPFPGFPSNNPPSLFVMDSRTSLQGVLVEEITPLRISYRGLVYFRMVVDTGGAPVSWAVLVQIPSPYQSHLDVPDIGKLKTGTRIVVQGSPAKDGSHRIFLVRSTSARATTLGIELAP